MNINNICTVCEKEIKKDLNDNKLYFRHYVWIFFIVSILGYIIEVLYHLVSTGVFENKQGLVFGPFSPIYGLGAILFVIIAKLFSDKSDLFIQIISGLLGGLFEAIASLWQELSFGTTSWHYNKYPILGGRTSVFYMMIWGLLGLLFVRYMYPLIRKTINFLEGKVNKIITYIVVIFLFLNIVISITAVDRWYKRIDNIPANNIVAKAMDKYFGNEVLERVYPNMKIAKERK